MGSDKEKSHVDVALFLNFFLFRCHTEAKKAQFARVMSGWTNAHWQTIYAFYVGFVQQNVNSKPQTTG